MLKHVLLLLATPFVLVNGMDHAAEPEDVYASARNIADLKALFVGAGYHSKARIVNDNALLARFLRQTKGNVEDAYFVLNGSEAVSGMPTRRFFNLNGSRWKGGPFHAAIGVVVWDPDLNNGNGGERTIVRELMRNPRAMTWKSYLQVRKQEGKYCRGGLQVTMTGLQGWDCRGGRGPANSYIGG